MHIDVVSGVFQNCTGGTGDAITACGGKVHIKFGPVDHHITIEYPGPKDGEFISCVVAAQDIQSVSECTMVEDNLVIVGDYNVVHGNSCVVCGRGNFVDGVNCLAYGVHNAIMPNPN